MSRCRRFGPERFLRRTERELLVRFQPAPDYLLTRDFFLYLYSLWPTGRSHFGALSESFWCVSSLLLTTIFSFFLKPGLYGLWPTCRGHFFRGILAHRDLVALVVSRSAQGLLWM